MRLGTAALAVAGFALGAMAACWWSPRGAAPRPAFIVAEQGSFAAVAECAPVLRAQQLPAPRGGSEPAGAAPRSRAHERIDLGHDSTEVSDRVLYLEGRHPDLAHILGKRQLRQLAIRWSELQEGQSGAQTAPQEQEDPVQVALRAQLDSLELDTLQPLQEWIGQELGAEAGQKFATYLGSLGARKLLQPLRATLINAGATLDGGQVELLAGAMQEAQAEFSSQRQSLWESEPSSQAQSNDATHIAARYDRQVPLIERRLQRLLEATRALPSQQQQVMAQALRRQTRSDLLQLERRKLEAIRDRQERRRRHYEDSGRYSFDEY